MMKSSRLIIILTACALFILPGVAYAQTTHYTIGYFLWFSSGAFKTQMADLGYVDGENVTYLEIDTTGFETMTMEEATNNMQKQIQTIVDAHPDAIVTNTDTDALNVQSMTKDIPIVFARSDDPVATGAVADLINPGGNTTGIITNRPHERRLQLLTEILPSTDEILYLYSPLTGEGETVLQQVRNVAETLGVKVDAAPVTDLQGAMDAFNNMPEGVDWLFLTPYVLWFVPYPDTNDLFVQHHVGVAGVTDLPVQGYLMGYGPNIDDSDSQAARMVDLILRGASPSDMPVQTAENFLMINLEQAQAMDMTIPESLLRQANLIIRPGYFDNLTSIGG